MGSKPAKSLTRILHGAYYKSLQFLPEWLAKFETVADQIRNLRSALGMTQAQLAKRTSQSSELISRLESTKESNPRLSTLFKIADGLECELVLKFVPKKPTHEILKERAQKKAEEMIELSKGTSALEEQQPDKSVIQQQLATLIAQLMNKPSQLWED